MGKANAWLNIGNRTEAFSKCFTAKLFTIKLITDGKQCKRVRM